MADKAADEEKTKKEEKEDESNSSSDDDDSSDDESSDDDSSDDDDDDDQPSDPEINNIIAKLDEEKEPVDLPKQKSTRKAKIKSILLDYAQLSSTHAVDHIGEAHTYRLLCLLFKMGAEKLRAYKRSKMDEIPMLAGLIRAYEIG